MASCEWQVAYSQMNRSVATHMKSYRDLEIWERGMRIAELAYRLTRDFP